MKAAICSVSLVCILIVGVSWVAHAAQVKITASDADDYDYFGASVSISGHYVIVGAYNENGGRGSAYIFVRDGSSWNQQAKITGDTGMDIFGFSVSISGDYIIVGAPYDNDSGCAYIFVRDGTDWSQQAKLTASDAATGASFGWAVSINGDYAIVGAKNDDDGGSSSGSAYIFKRNGESWTEQAKLTASDAATGDYFGCSVSISGDYVIIGARDAENETGSAYIFVRDGTSWTEQAKLKASDPQPGVEFGNSVSISGEYVIVGAYDSTPGWAYIFVRTGTSWDQQIKLTASDAAQGDHFGGSVSLSGNYAIIGAQSDGVNGVGSAYSFLRSGSSWSEKAKVSAYATGTLFGSSVSISGDYVIVGAYWDDHHHAGAAYIYHSIDDLSLPVELNSFTATAGDEQVTLRWATESETDNLGFNVYRALEAEDTYERLTPEMIAGAGNTATRQSYTFTDIRLTNGVTYWYKLEDVAFDGTRTMHGPIAVTPQAKEEVLASVVKLSSFTAQAEDEQVTLQWIAEGETANLSFLVYRASEEDGVYERLTQEVVTSTGGQAYVFTDSELSQSGTYWYMLEVVSSDGIWTKHGPISVTVQAQVEVVVSLPEGYALSPCYPNPFNASTTIRYQLSEPGGVRLAIYDVLGQEVTALVSERQPAGWYRVSWDGRDGAGRQVSSGVYLYRLEVEEEFLETKKMVMVR